MTQTVTVKKNEQSDFKGQYLTFFLGEEEYGIDISHVREIIEVLNITSVPNSHDYLKGVINLRGKVVPVIDIGLKIGLPECVPTERSCIIVVEFLREFVGMVVDSVSEVLDITNEEFDETSFLGQNINERFINGIGKVGGKIKILLDIKNILALEEDENSL